MKVVNKETGGYRDLNYDDLIYIEIEEGVGLSYVEWGKGQEDWGRCNAADNSIPKAVYQAIIDRLTKQMNEVGE